ncbi:MAG TPA: polysaccharide biosynthesis tyrosine autokinase [Nostocaceae cyanobacterium]|nr:polysaccharide biosynthesis tyrosine autokinase [Nostocaceae cyanobacterium]
MAKTSLTQKSMFPISTPNYTQSLVNIKQIYTILLHRQWLILGISCLVMSATSLAAITTKPKYQSSMQIMVSANLVGDAKNELINHHNFAADYTTQMKLMMSSKLVQKAVDLLHNSYPNLSVNDIKGDGETGKQAALEVKVLGDISGSNGVSGQVFVVSFKDRDPVKTKRVLQALQKTYQDYNIEQRNQRLNQGLAFVNTRLPKVQNEVLAAENKVVTFRKKYNLVDPAIQSKILLESLIDVQKQLQNTRSQLQDVETRYNSLQQAIALSSQNAQLTARLMQSSRYQALTNELKRTEQALAEERLRYKDSYPTIVKLKQKYQIQLSLLQQEITDQENTGINNSEPLLEIDQKLIDELNQLKIIAQKLAANENNLVKSEQQISSQLNSYPAIIAEYNRLVADVQTHRKTLEQLIQVQQSLGMKITQSGFDWQVLDEPDLGIYIGSRRWLLILGGVIAGPILGIIAALMRECFNQAVFSTQVLQSFTKLHLLGAVPKLEKHNFKTKIMQMLRKWRHGKQLSLIENHSKLPSHESLDMIYQNMHIFQHPTDFKSVMVTSALSGEGKTTLALGLGASAAHMHQRVLVIDANLRYPSLHKILELSNDWGLSLLLVDEFSSELHNYVQPIHPSIDILTAGPIPEDTVSLLSSERLKELIKSFEEIYDLVLIDAPAILNTVDARLVASSCNAIILVSRMGQITLNELSQATEILSKLNLIGIVANNVLGAGKISPSTERTGKVRLY